MNYADWSTLKTASKVAFKKEGNEIFLEQKRYDSETGEEISPGKIAMDVAGLESQKESLTLQKNNIQAELTEVGKMITQIKKV